MKHIQRIDVNNFKRVRDITISAQRGLVLIGGRNRQGKSSLLDAIIATLGGQRMICEEPVRRGADSATTRVTVDGLVIVRKFKKDGTSTVSVRSDDGGHYGQARLNELFSKLGPDPVAFLSKKPAEQAETARELIGVDFTGIDAVVKATFERRTDLGRDLRKLEAQLEAMGAPFSSAPPSKLSSAHILDEIKKGEEINRRNYQERGIHDGEVLALARYAEEIEAKRARVRQLDVEGGAIDQAITKWSEELPERCADVLRDASMSKWGAFFHRVAKEATEMAAQAAHAAEKEEVAERLLEEVEELEAARKALEATVEERRPRLEAAVRYDDTAHRAQLEQLEAINGQVEHNARRAALVLEVERLRVAVQALSDKLEDCERQKVAMLAAAKFPIAGLSFADGRLLLNGLPFAQASAAEQLSTAVALGLAANPELRVLLIRNGAFLDEDSLRALEALAEEHDAQFWVERVGSGDPEALIVEDGRLVGVDEGDDHGFDDEVAE